MNRHPSLLTCVLTLILAVPTLGDDLRPPDYRSKPLSTVAGWDFLTDQERHMIRPDANVPLWVGDAAGVLQEKFQPDGPYPSAALIGDASYTYAQGGGYVGGSMGDGGIVFVVPNWLETSPVQRMRLRLQVTYQGEEPPTTVVGYSDFPGTSVEVTETIIARVPVKDPSLPPGSAFFYEDWLVTPSPAWEQVVVFLPPETQLLQVVIDTVIEILPIFENGFEPGEVTPWGK